MALTKVSYSMITGAPVNVLDYGADLTGVTNSSAAITAAIAAGSVVYFPAGTYKLNAEILIDKSVLLLCDPSNEYGSEGTIFNITHDDPAKAGFKVGTVTNNIQFEIQGIPTFKVPDATYDAFAGLWCQAKTVYIDGLRGTVNINGAYFNNCYIGSVQKLSGTGKTYLCKVDGDSSLVFQDVNLGSSTGGLASFQIVTTGGFTRVENIYLEAQTTRNLAITSVSRSTVYIGNVYGENSSFYDIYILDSENVIIENYRTNTNTQAIIVENSTNVKLNNIIAVDRLAANAIVTITANCNNVFIGGVLYDPISSDGVGIREYVCVRGVFNGNNATPMIINPDLMLSANGTTSTVGGASVTSNVPADSRLVFSNNSIGITDAAPLKIPFTKWEASQSVVVQLIYKCTTSGANDVIVSFVNNGITEILSLNSFHVANAGFQMITFVTRLPSTTDVNQYSNIQVKCAAGKTAEVHYLNLSQYDGGMLPFGFVDESILFEATSLTLNTLNDQAIFVPRLGAKQYRFKAYELVYATSTGAGTAATVAFGDADSSGALSATYGSFTTATSQGAGLPCNTLAANLGSYPFSDHTNATANGWLVKVTAAATTGGTAKAFIRAVAVEPNAI